MNNRGAAHANDLAEFLKRKKRREEEKWREKIRSEKRQVLKRALVQVRLRDATWGQMRWVAWASWAKWGGYETDQARHMNGREEARIRHKTLVKQVQAWDILSKV